MSDTNPLFVEDMAERYIVIECRDVMEKCRMIKLIREAAIRETDKTSQSLPIPGPWCGALHPSEHVSCRKLRGHEDRNHGCYIDHGALLEWPAL